MKRVELIEIPGQVALMALGQPWMTINHWADIMSACCLGLDLSEDNPEIHTKCSQVIDLMQANSTDHATIKHLAGTIIQWLGTQSNVKIYNATMRRLKILDEQERISRNSAENNL